MSILRHGLRHSSLIAAPIVGTWSKRLGATASLRTIGAVGVIAILSVIAGAVLLIVELRAREIAEARRGLANLSAVLGEGTSRALEGVDLVLANVVDDLRAAGVTTADDLRRLKDDRRTYDMLRARVSGLAQLDAISVVTSDGRLTSFSRTFPTPDVDLSDRQHFRDLASSSAILEPFLSEPVQNRVTGDWSVYLARRLLDPQGGLVGIVYGAIDLGYFKRLYGRIDLGRSGAIGLWDLDGRSLVRLPQDQPVGARFVSPALTGLTALTPPAVFDDIPGPDGRSRMVARRIVDGFSLTSTVSRTMTNVLAEWRRQAVILAVSGALLAASLLAVLIAVIRQISAYEAVARAIRERETAVQGLEEVAAQLRQSQKMEAMGQLTSGLAHDFNNLLTVVIGNLELLSRRLSGTDATLRRHIDGAMAGAHRASTLTNRLLAFSRRQPLQPSRLGLNAVVEDIADILRQTLGARTVLILDLAPDVGSVYADPNGLESALLNLVVNARDAMPEGGRLTVETRLVVSEQGRVLALTVSDTGSGMSQDVIGRAFEPFFTTKDPGVGTGLGLAQVYGFAQQSGGSVGIDSQEGVGTRVTIALPDAVDDAAESRPRAVGTGRQP